MPIHRSGIDAMAKKFKNIMEDIALDFLDSTLEKRPSVCTCSDCVNAMMAQILSQLSPKYVITEEDALKTIIDQTKIEREADIARAVISAIDTVSKAPPHKARQKEDKDLAFKLLLDKIYEDRGLDFRHYHQPILQRRVALRMHKSNTKTFSEYLMYLIKNPEEYDKLFEVLCINVSEFFRDPDVWEAVRGLLSDLVQIKKKEIDKTLTIWSSACASGEEPYSIAILLKDILGKEAAFFNIKLYATDIDPKALRACEKALYPKSGLKNVKEEYLRDYFTPVDATTWKLNDEIKKMVSFGKLDLISSEFIENTDVVFCRNVFIYFSRSLQDQLLMKYYKSLVNGGFLVIGKTETMWNEARSIFEEIDFNAHIYRRKQAE